MQAGRLCVWLGISECLRDALGRPCWSSYHIRRCRTTLPFLQLAPLELATWWRNSRQRYRNRWKEDKLKELIENLM